MSFGRNNPVTGQQSSWARRLEMVHGNPQLISQMSHVPQTPHGSVQFAKVEELWESRLISASLPTSETSSMKQLQLLRQRSNQTIISQPPTTEQILISWQTLRKLIDSPSKPLHGFQLIEYAKPVLLMGIKYVSDCRAAILGFSCIPSPLAIASAPTTDTRLATLDAAWKWYETNLPRYFGDNPLGELRKAEEMEHMSVAELRVKLEKDVCQLREAVEKELQVAKKAEAGPWK